VEGGNEMDKCQLWSCAERTVLMKQLVEYKKQKLEMERHLFGQFLAVLNSKKEYIQQLENRLPGMITLHLVYYF
jgi:hypothetical protein